ncbi:MAG: FGGY family carbohydrate kinase [Actinomycetota bacterium]
MDVVLALDLGTGSVRACLVSCEGKVLARGQRRLHSRAPAGIPTGREYDERELREAIAASVTDARAAARAGTNIAAVTVACMRPACAFLDSAGSPLYLGANRDARGFMESMDLMRHHRDLLYRVTGQLPPILAWSARIAWFRANRPEILDATSKVTGLEGWVLSLFGAEPALDHSSASGTGLYDVRAGGWSEELLDVVGLKESRLSPVVQTGASLGEARGEFSRSLSLEGALVCAGAADSHAAMAGTGGWEPGDTAIVAGTTMPVLRLVSEPGPTSPRLWATRYVREGLGVLEANCGESGFAWEWLARALEIEVDELEGLAAKAPPAGVFAHLGTAPQDFSDLVLVRNGGFFFPLPPSMFGVERTGMARAAIESAAWAAAEAIAWLDADAPGDSLRVTGGMTRSRLWLACLASALGRPLLVAQEDAASVGAAAFAAAGAGLVGDAHEVVRAAAKLGWEISADASLVDAMRGGLARWREVVAGFEQGAARVSNFIGGAIA